MRGKRGGGCPRVAKEGKVGRSEKNGKEKGFFGDENGKKDYLRRKR